MQADTHFLLLALQGGFPGASSGEKQAKVLLECLIKNIPGLDYQAVEGLCDFARDVSRCPSECLDLLERWEREA